MTEIKEYWDSLSEEAKFEFIKEYRRLVRISDMFESNGELFPFMTDAVEQFIPAYRYDLIHDEIGDLNDQYHALCLMAKNYSVSDEDFFEIAKGE